jgi:hypothetical protein
MRFHWIKPKSRACFISAVAIQSELKKMTVDQAIDYTLSLDNDWGNRDDRKSRTAPRNLEKSNQHARKQAKE